MRNSRAGRFMYKFNSKDLLPQILATAQEAGDAIMKIYRAMLVVEDAQTEARLTYKNDGSPLTQADLLAHTTIARALATLTPDIPVVSEEEVLSQSHRKPTGLFWLVDPLDGTKEFLARNDEFTVNIALIHNGEAVLGVVLAPALGQAYWGSRETGAFRASHGHVDPIHVARPASTPQQPLRVIASKSHMNAETAEFIKQLGPHEVVQAGSSLKFCRIAEGGADIYPRMGPTCEWDTAAAQAVLEAAGGCVLQLNGRPLHYGKADVLNPHFVASAWRRRPWEQPI